MNDDSTAQNLMRDRSPTVVALDNLIRRKLRVSDPSDPQEIAQALRKYYRAEAAALEREAEGLPFLLAAVPTAAPPVVTSSQAEVDQAVADVERDLQTLITNSLLKDIEPELKGWATAIRAAVADGLNAARQTLDPRQRDLAFANRRLLGDYARVARFVGALTPNLNLYYRRLAQSLDEVAGVMLVLMGEALANIGFAGGRFLLQVPLSELQARRDAVIFALRNFLGSTQEAYGPNEWPRGLVAYSQLLERLEASGQSDLKALLQENNLARLMDDLIHRAAGGSAEGLRALGATAQPTLQSFRRLILLGNRQVEPESPPLSSFLAALHLFLQAFENATSGFRLLFISRPPIVFYGLYGIAGADELTEKLLDLINHRNRLANHLDCFLGCSCGKEEVTCQILLDKILYDLDRVIDLYILSPDDEEESLERAAAYAALIDEVLDTVCKKSLSPPLKKLLAEDIQATLLKLKNPPPFDLGVKAIKIKGNQVAVVAMDNTAHGDSITGSPDKEITDLNNIKLEVLGAKLNAIFQEMLRIAQALDLPLDLVIRTKLNVVPDPDDPTKVLDVAGELEDLADMSAFMLQELCMQKAAEEKWLSLLKSMTPSCLRSRELLGQTVELIEEAMDRVAGTRTCPDLTVSIPPPPETSAAGRTYGRYSTGEYED